MPTTFRVVALAALAAVSALPSAAAEQPSWELRPYRIQVLLAAESSSEWTPHRRAQISRGLVARSEALAGSAWKLDVVDAPLEVARPAQADLDRLDESPAVLTLFKQSAFPPESSKREPLDKLIVLVLASTDSGYAARAREWDAYTGLWGPPITRTVSQASGLSHAAFAAVEAAFGPLARVESAAAEKSDAKPDAKSDAKAADAAGKTAEPAKADAAKSDPAKAVEEPRVELRVWGNNLPTRSGSLAAVQKGDVFRVVRRTGRGSEVRGTPLDGTFLSVEKVGVGQATCRVHSRFRAPLTGVSQGEEYIAIGVSAPRRSTQLHLVSAADPAAALAGFEVVSYSPGFGGVESLGSTDRQGTLEIAPGDSPLRVLLVKRGTALLARLPLVPGWPLKVELPLVSDDQLLLAQGVVAGLEQQLLEAVTRREILLARARARMTPALKSQAQPLITELQGFEKIRQDLEKLINEEKTRVAAADPDAQRQIDAMFEKLLSSVTKHLDPLPVQQLTAEVTPPAK